MTNSIIQIRNLCQSYHGQEVLHNIDLDIERGEFITLLGPSGCGKTTLLRLISGLESPDSGEIIINGHDVTQVSPQERFVNTVFQSFALFPHMNVYDNVAFGLRCQHVAKDEINERVIAALEMVKLEKFIHRKPNQLSGGQQQRVAIARAVINKPLVLLLDEPLSALDYRLRKNMQMELKALQRQLGITFVFVTHDQEEALSMSDRVAVIQEGNIEQLGTPREVYEEPNTLAVAKFIGEVNIFDTEIIEINNDDLTVNIEGRTLTLKNHKGFRADQKIYTLLRPEDIKVWDESEVTDTSNMLPAVIEEVIYKGSLVDLSIRLPSDRIIYATEFFNEDDDTLNYVHGEKVWVEWYPGWEVILPHED